MEINETDIPDVKLLTPRKFGDHRGFFVESYNRKVLESIGFTKEFVQDNHSLSVPVGTVRGLHFQLEPHAQDKLVRVVRGAILDVAVDLRRDSPTFGRHVKARLDASLGQQILVPAGFAHGFVTLEPDTEVIYKVTAFYAPQHDRGLLWNDPELGIDWPIGADEAVLSDKDKIQPRLAELPELF
jgi:dTDP-4-dehydrorhamnose 3,5-epimerase